MNMKVIAINGSPRKNSNTSILINYVLAELKKSGIETELLNLAETDMVGCRACTTCVTQLNKRCVINKDFFNEYFDKMINAQGIILGSPTYVADVSSQMKAFIDRATYVSRANNHLLKNKVGAAVVAVRRAGALNALDTINHMFLVSQMIVVGSSYWNVGFGKAIGEVEQDNEGIQTMIDLGRNMGWILKKMHP